MTAAEGGEDQFARVGLARRHGHARGALVHGDQRTHVAEVQLWMDAMHVQVHGHLHDVQVAGALTIAEQGAFHTVGPCQQAQFRGGGAGATVIVRVQAYDQGIAVLDVGADPLDLIRVHVGHRDLDGVRQIENHLLLRRGLPHVHHGLADFPGILHLRGAEAFGRVLQGDLRALVFQAGQAVLDHLGTAHRDLHDLRLALAEHVVALRGRGGVVHVNDHALRAFQREHGLLNQILTGLHQALDGHVVRNTAVLDQAAVEFELGVGGGRKAHLDLFEAGLHQRREHVQLLRHVHRHRERLVAVAQVHAAPDGRV